MIFVGVDWAEAHHDIAVKDGAGKTLLKRRLPEGVEGVRRFHELVAEHAEEPSEVLIAIETDRGLFVGALVAAGYEVFAINPFSASRYRDRHVTSGAKSDPGDAEVLADLVRTDRHAHRPIAGDTELAEAIKVLARAHQSMIWTRQRGQLSLRSTLREFYPAALDAFDDLAAGEALAVLERGPTPLQGRALSLSKIAAALRRGGRQRRVDERAAEVQAALRAEHLQAPPLVADAFGVSVGATVSVLSELNRQITQLETQIADRFEQHPDAQIIRSLPGLGMTLGARVLGEFGDDPTRFSSPKSRKNYAGTSPITRASGTRRVILARHARNRRLADAIYLWAFASLTRSPGARALYDRYRAAGASHHQALRALGNRLVGVLHGCLRTRTSYNEATAWHTQTTIAA
jgi:Transposase/Transposase IS116/IS110/IS902 family